MAVMSPFAKGMWCLIGGFSIHLFLGCLYLFGNIQVYITSYLYMYDKSVTLNKTLIVGPILTTTQALTVFLGPFMLKYVSPTIILVSGCIIALGGIFASTFVTSFSAFIILYGFYYGVGIGIWYLVPLAWAWDYFPKRKGLVSGIIIGGFGFGAFFFGFISFALVNPENDEPDLAVDGGFIFKPDTPQANGAPRMLRINCIIWLVLILIALLTIHKKAPEPRQRQQIRRGRGRRDDTDERETFMTSNMIDSANAEEDRVNNSVVPQEVQIAALAQQPHPEVPFKNAIKDSRTWLLALMIGMSVIQGVLISYIFKNYGLKYIPNDKFITTVGTIGAIANGLSRSFWANLLDRFPFKFVYGALLLVQIAIGFSMNSIKSYKALYLIWVTMSFFCLGGHFTLSPTIWGKMYGNKTGARIYSIVFLTISPAGIIALLLSKFLYKSWGYGRIIYIWSGLSWISFIILMFFKQKK